MINTSNNRSTPSQRQRRSIRSSTPPPPPPPLPSSQNHRVVKAFTAIHRGRSPNVGPSKENVCPIPLDSISPPAAVMPSKIPTSAMTSARRVPTESNRNTAERFKTGVGGVGGGYEPIRVSQTTRNYQNYQPTRNYQQPLRQHHMAQQYTATTSTGPSRYQNHANYNHNQNLMTARHPPPRPPLHTQRHHPPKHYPTATRPAPVYQEASYVVQRGAYGDVY